MFNHKISTITTKLDESIFITNSNYESNIKECREGLKTYLENIKVSIKLMIQ